MMKIKYMLGAVLACAALAACSGLTAAAPAGNSAVATAALTADKALAEAHLTYNTVASAVLAGIRSGLITGAAKVRVKQLDTQVYGTLQKADAATDVAQRAALAAQATGLLGQMRALVPVSP